MVAPDGRVRRAGYMPVGAVGVVGGDVSKPTSPYLLRPLRSEAEVRALGEVEAAKLVPKTALAYRSSVKWSTGGRSEVKAGVTHPPTGSRSAGNAVAPGTPGPLPHQAPEGDGMSQQFDGEDAER